MNDLSASAAQYSARPALRIGGARNAALERALTALAIEEDGAGLARCEATFANWGPATGGPGFLWFDRRTLDFGAELSIEIGAGDRAGAVFGGRISAIEGRFPKTRPPEALILAEDRLQDLRMTRRSRSFENVELADIARSIAGDHGLSAEVEAGGPRWSVADQLDQSDLAFLRSRAALTDRAIAVTGNRLVVRPGAGAGQPDLRLTYGQGLVEIVATADLADQRSSVVVGGWDVAAKQAIAAEAGAAAIAAEAQGDTGPALAERVYGARPERISHLSPAAPEEARALAAAAMRRRARGFATAEAVAEGDARLRAGARVALAGLGALFDGIWEVTAVRHLFDLDDGLRTQFSAARAWIGRV